MLILSIILVVLFFVLLLLLIFLRVLEIFKGEGKFGFLDLFFGMMLISIVDDILRGSGLI